MFKHIKRILGRTEGSAPVYDLQLPTLKNPLKMRVHDSTDVHISSSLAAEGIWEPSETRFIMNSLELGANFLDVGANIGYFSLIASRLVGAEGMVHAFEPDPENFHLLEQNCALNRCGNVRAYQVALSDHDSEGTLYLSADNMGDHTIYPTGEDRDSIPIKLVRGDSLFSATDNRIDCLKIDTQGAEYQVIKGMLPVISANLPQLIMIVELSPNSMTGTGVTGIDFLNLFNELPGYFYILEQHCHRLIPISREELDQWVRLTGMDPNSEGFVNLIFSGNNLEQHPRHEVRVDLDLFDNALQYLLASSLLPWDGTSCDADGMKEYIYLSSGWCFPETWGTWSQGSVSEIKFMLSPKLSEMTSPVLHLRGEYFGEPELTSLSLNGQPLGAHDLQSLDLPLSPDLLQGDHLTLRLDHTSPTRPCDVGAGDDQRELKFGIASIAITPG